jgi:3-phenylpropionate/trans-cinnamate dioxygenase ferredoxin reductase component
VSRERFVIVGASLTGGTAAATLRHEGFDGDVILIGAEPHPPYERPPLSKKFLRSEATFDDAILQPMSFYRNNSIDTLFGTPATGLDTDRRTVALEGGEKISYDRLLIATGARNRRLPIPGLDLNGVYDLRTVDDAERIRAEMEPGRKVVVAGMGFIGSEVAASMRQRGVEVVAIDGAAVPLERVLGEEVGRVLADVHAEHGVRMIFHDRVESFQGDGRVERVLTAGGEQVDCDFAVVGVGVEPVTDLAAGTDIELDNGIVVDRFTRTNVEDVFAAGDVANHESPIFGTRVRVEHWQNAIKHGKAAALNMLDRQAPYEDVYWFWSDQYDVNLQYSGYHHEWDQIVVRGSLGGRDFAAFYVKGGRVQAVVGLNRGKDVRQSVPLIKARSVVDPEKLRDPEVALGSLA